MASSSARLGSRASGVPPGDAYVALAAVAGLFPPLLGRPTALVFEPDVPGGVDVVSCWVWHPSSLSAVHCKPASTLPAADPSAESSGGLVNVGSSG
ncbi:hypothetical protein PF001_g31154 [Phytophthora fragariae]|nr:hypothetical protein PF001_g31154 [Phytophthora fragariae]